MQPSFLISISQVAFVRNIVINLLLHFRKELVEESRSTSKVSNSKKVKSRIFVLFDLDVFELL